MKKLLNTIQLLTILTFSHPIKAGNTSSWFYDANQQLLSVVQNESIEQIENVIENGANIDAKFGENQNTVLHFAASQNSPKTIICLLKNNANINSQNKFKATPLHIAVDKESTNAVVTLIENNAFINAKNEYGQTPLHLAVLKENFEIIKYLIDYGASHKIKSDSGKNVFDYTKETTQPKKISNLLKNKILDINKKERQEKKKRKNNLKKTKELEEKERHRRIQKEKLEQKKKELERLKKQLDQKEIEMLSKDNEIDKLSKKLEENLIINEQHKMYDEDIHSTLYNLLTKFKESEKQNKKIELEILKNQNRLNSLTQEVHKKKRDQKYINEKKAATKIQKAFKLYQARKKVNELIELKKQILKEMSFIEKQQTTSMQNIKILKHKVIQNINNVASLKDKNNNTLMHLFATYGLLDDIIIKKFINLNIDNSINKQNNNGKTALYLAVLYGYEESAKQLLLNDAKKNIADNKGITPLHLAILTNNSRSILDPTTDICRQNETLIDWLFSFKLIAQEDDYGYTPFDYAINLNQQHSVYNCIHSREKIYKKQNPLPENLYYKKICTKHLKEIILQTLKHQDLRYKKGS